MISLYIMYHCQLCFEKYTEGSIANNKVNTVHQTNVFQCNQCFYINDPIFIYDYGEICPICFEFSNNKCLYECHHWICNSCNEIGKVVDCPICMTPSNKIIIDKNQSFRYFDDLKPNVKQCFKKLYAQINDSIGKQLNIGTNKDILYHLCVDYHRFLQLLFLNDNNNNESKLSSSYWIDQIWHEHLLDNANYNEVCLSICGYILYHYPENSFNVNASSQKSRQGATMKMYKDKFGELNKLIWPPFYKNICKCMHLHIFFRTFLLRKNFIALR